MNSSVSMAAPTDASPSIKAWAGAALRTLLPALAWSRPVVKRVGWKWMATSVVVGTAGFLLWRGFRANKEGSNARQPGKPPEINRWESEGGMVATSVPATMADKEPSQRPVDSHGDVGAGAGDPPLNG